MLGALGEAPECGEQWSWEVGPAVPGSGGRPPPWGLAEEPPISSATSAAHLVPGTSVRRLNV